MASPILSLSFFLLPLFLLSGLPLHSPRQEPSLDTCPHFDCGNLTNITFPFTNTTNRLCGWPIECNSHTPTIQFKDRGRSYIIKNISLKDHTLVLQDEQVYNHLQSDVCDFLVNISISIPEFHFISPMVTFFVCDHGHYTPPRNYTTELYSYTGCNGHDLFYTYHFDSLPPQNLPYNCTMLRFPLIQQPAAILAGYSVRDLLSLLAAGFVLQWDLAPECSECTTTGGFCFRDSGTRKFTCSHIFPFFQNPNRGGKKSDGKKKIIIGLSIGIVGFLLACVICFIVFQSYKNKCRSILSPAISAHPLSESQPGNGHAFQTPVFTYEELEKATGNFDSAKELGGGASGTVYLGKLRDGRSVAVKRLYEYNYNSMEQFVNEISILSQLRHQNLVMLYGCTSRHSHELLIVYEFISNGTLADHLHGDRSKNGALSWHTRLRVAIETADALAYLHAVEIIHRDVKTSNMLLDDNFRVKVADFGVSLLFPKDMSHVTTSPHGTPGYVDPDYYECYKLTKKSDVYSFGVVLIELISSRLAVDITRHQEEIKLSNMAINKIQNGVLNELVDPGLGFESDDATKRMITLVAELAFRCLQDRKEIRPSMEEVLEVLREIERAF